MNRKVAAELDEISNNMVRGISVSENPECPYANYTINHEALMFDINLYILAIESCGNSFPLELLTDLRDHCSALLEATDEELDRRIESN